jgi:hypothetical protein
VADVFNQVDSDYRAARMRDLVARGWPYAAAALVAVVVVILGFVAWSRHADAEAARASQRYAAGFAAAQAGRTDEARRDFAEVAGGGAPPAYRTLALMQQAGLDLKTDRPADALRLLDEAARTAPDRILGDAAALQAAYLAMDTRPLPEVENRLAPLLDAKRPYRDMAREALAIAKLAAGRPQEARRDLQLLVLSQDVSEPARARAQAALAMIDSGAAATLPAAARALAALPPPHGPAGPDAAIGAQ